MTIEEKYQQWLNDPRMEADLKADLEQMTEAEKQDAFYMDAEFGTGGMRCLLGAGTNRLNVYTVRKVTTGFARWLNRHYPHPTVAISYDNRLHSADFARESAKVLAANGIKSYVFESLRPTPELSYAVRYLHCSGGIMITASHNTKEYNGYKVYDETGCQMVPDLVQGVIDEIQALGGELVESPALSEEQKSLIEIIGESVDAPYLGEVEKIQLNPDLDKSGFRLVFTSQQGTSYKCVVPLFEELNYDAVYVKEQLVPDTEFSATVTPNPEDPRAYELAIRYAEANDADILISTDPDGDRIGVAVKKDGKYVLMTGNQTGAVLQEYVYSQMTEKGLMPEHPVMFNTVVTGDLGEKVAAHYGVECEKTLTGFKYIGSKIHHYEQTHEKEFVFGYEESYGYLIKPFVRDKDATQSTIMIAECANYYKQQGLTMLDVLEQLYQQYGTYEESQMAMAAQGKEGKEKIARMMDDLRQNVPAQIAGHAVVRFQDFREKAQYIDGKRLPLEGFDVSNVLKFFLDDESWIAIRPSGTEPKCKFYYCVKGTDHQDCAEKTRQYHEAIAALTE
jgi:phosphoglucomutase